MDVDVLLFASLRERAGCKSVKVEFSGLNTVGSLRREIERQYPDLQPGLSTSRVAVNQQFQDDSHPIDGTEEIALIPPVSGG